MGGYVTIAPSPPPHPPPFHNFQPYYFSKVRNSAYFPFLFRLKHWISPLFSRVDSRRWLKGERVIAKRRRLQCRIYISNTIVSGILSSLILFVSSCNVLILWVDCFFEGLNISIYVHIYIYMYINCVFSVVVSYLSYRSMLAQESVVRTVTVHLRVDSEIYGIRCVFWHQKSLNQLQKVPLFHVVMFYNVLLNLHITIWFIFINENKSSGHLF